MHRLTLGIFVLFCGASWGASIPVKLHSASGVHLEKGNLVCFDFMQHEVACGKVTEVQANEASLTLEFLKKDPAQDDILVLRLKEGTLNPKAPTNYRFQGKLGETLVLRDFADKSQPIAVTENASEAKEGGKKRFMEKVQLLRFNVDGIAAIQGSGYSLSAEAGWLPTYTLSPKWTVGPLLGLTAFNDNTGVRFLVTEYSLLAGYHFRQYIAELGGGAQTWFIDSTTAFTIRAQFSMDREAFYKIGRVEINRLFVGYSAVLAPAALFHQIRIGVGFQLGKKA